MDLVTEASQLLRSHGYKVTHTTRPRPTIYFEDASVLGAVVNYKFRGELKSEWEADQSDFLKSHAFQLRKAGAKAWNTYFVLLSADASESNSEQALSIEEDFRGARKLVGLGLVTIMDLQRLLLPLLPIQNEVRPRQVDEQAELMERLDLTPGAKALLREGGSPEDLARAILEGA